jgi:ABC-type nickel/cobalt efflux system permease component RcnA
VVAVLLTGVALALMPASPASAHPLGNFTVNTADQVVLTADGVDVLHVVDLAEIPTVQLRQRVTAAGGLPAYARGECARIAPLLTLTVDEKRAALSLLSSTGRVVPGAAGLNTTRLECRLRSPLQPERSVAYVDGAIDERVGWKEVTVNTRCGSLRNSDVPRTSPSRLLTSYPSDLLSSPPDVRGAQASVQRGPCAASSDPSSDAVLTALPRGVGGITAFFTDFLVRKDLTVAFALLSVLASVAFGVVHALAPGHGKTVMAAYLVGQRGTRRQALQLGSIVTFTHTASVLALGALLTLGTLAAPERVVPLTEVLSGLLLAGLGVYLLVPALRRVRSGRQHQRGHGHDHGHDHAHAHAHALEHSHGGVTHVHAELPEGRLGWRTLAGMGVAGGLVPSPSALVVLLGATALGRAWFGVLLVLCYGIGMAITLTAAGLLLLRAQGAIERRGWTLRRGRDLARLLPIATASVVVMVGIGLVARGVMTSRSLL